MSVGIFQILLVVLVVLLLFGSGRITKLMSELGKGIKSFKEGMGEDGQKPKNKKKK